MKMKYAALSIIALILSAPAHAQEQQIYSYNSVNSVYNPQMEQAIRDSYAARAQQAYTRYQPVEQNRPYMERFPDHPGDYRDAVDRGNWAAGNATGYAVSPHYAQ